MTTRTPAAIAAILALSIFAVGCGPKTPDYQSFWTQTSTTTTETEAEKPVPFPIYLESIGVSGEQVAPSKLTDLTVSIPTPKGWSPYENPNYTPGTVAIAKNNGYPMAILMVFKLNGDFDAAETVKHAKDDAEIFENFKRLDTSDNNFHGFPSAMIEGSYDVKNQRLHSYNRNVIATGAALPKAAGQATPPAPQRYLVTLTVTTLAREAVAVAPGVEQVISGFTVAAK